VYDAAFVADVTIPDDTELEPGTDFVKTWRVRNNGTCAWEPGTAWVFDSGDRMEGPHTISVPAVAPGATTDVSVHLKAPDALGTYTGFWQLRRPSGEAFGTKSFVRIVVTNPELDVTVTPTPSATPTPTENPASNLRIETFKANTEQAAPGDVITLEWETTGASEVILYHLLPTGQLGSFWEVEADGSFGYNIDPAERNHTDFLLVASSGAGETVQSTLSISLSCPNDWFFEPAPDECPSGPALTSDAAEEHFEQGTMIWVKEQDLLYVLFDDGRSPQWRAYQDEWEEGDPVDDPNLTPPAGLYQPVRGFGWLWREESGMRERLGWAVDLERAFVTAVQHTSRPKYNDTYLRALGGGVWKLAPEGSDWSKIP
jgi:hypothetical protein